MIAKNKVGRPMLATDWLKPSKLKMIEKWALEGYTQKEIAKKINIGYSTWFDWKKAHPQFSEAFKKGLEAATENVVNSMYTSATGHYVDEVTEIYDADGILVEKKVVKKYIPPSNTAQIFWVKNMDPQTWNDRKQVEVSGELTTKKVELTPEEREKRIQELQAKLNGNG